MAIVPVWGQFGPDEFEVESTKKDRVAARFLKTPDRRNYIIDDQTGRPYIVPKNYDARATATSFAEFADRARRTVRSVPGAPLGSERSAIYGELQKAFRQGGYGDLQRPFPDVGNVVPAFIPAANFNLGLAAAASGITDFEAVLFGGLYNLWKNATNPKVRKGWEFGNNPDNPPHIRDGADQFFRWFRPQSGDTPAATPMHKKHGEYTIPAADLIRVAQHQPLGSTPVAQQTSDLQFIKLGRQKWDDTLGPHADAPRSFAEGSEHLRKLSQVPTSTPATADRRAEIEAELRKPRIESRYWRDPAMQDEYRSLLEPARSPTPLVPRPEDAIRKAEIEAEMRKGRLGDYFRPGSFLPEEYLAILRRETGEAETGL